MVFNPGMLKTCQGFSLFAEAFSVGESLFAEAFSAGESLFAKAENLSDSHCPFVVFCYPCFKG
jgi:hypothetical protein